MRGLVGFHTKTIQKRVKIEKGFLDLRGLVGILQKLFKKGSKLKRLLQFAWSNRISYKNHSKKGCFDLRDLVGFRSKTIKKRVKIEKVASISVL